MNMKLKEVIQTSKEGDKFWKVSNVLIRGNTIKYVRMVDSVLDKAMEEQPKSKFQYGAGRGKGRDRRRDRDGAGNNERRPRSEGANRGKSRGSRGGRQRVSKLLSYETSCFLAININGIFM
eukprot:TRINITY_DN3736_c0_g1_i1.p1 TRINITY_DN3736_c0_g1~~TRINITY_DN3736_c0_g1_i1.p1  ORF type:complete len:121 (+),score=20.57 TRINITY_DN3736_c0_g1_i1:279-641(+)